MRSPQGHWPLGVLDFMKDAGLPEALGHVLGQRPGAALKQRVRVIGQAQVVLHRFRFAQQQKRPRPEQLDGKETVHLRPLFVG